MSRTIMRVPFSANWEAVNSTVTSILLDEGFKEKDINGEKCWKKGTGMATAMQYVKVEYTQNELVLSGWLQAGVGSLAGPEMDLTGVVGIIPKKALKKRLDKIAQAVSALR
jgi:hypothetical protein